MLTKVCSRKESVRPRGQRSDLLGQTWDRKGWVWGHLHGNRKARNMETWQPGTGQCLHRADPQQHNHILRFHLFAKKKSFSHEFGYEYVFFPKFEVLFSNL